jgi:alpha-tubulin suppressor-like RCC1 family protein
VTQIATGSTHTCALLTSGAVRCWGYGSQGALGYGNSTQIGDNEDPADAGNVPLGGNAKYIAVGGYHSCAIMEDGAVRCWGNGSYGQLGYANTDYVGISDTPADVGDVEVGGEAVSLSLGTYHTCALLTDGTVVCWGYGNYGSLGYGDTNNQGDGENPSFEGAVAVGATVTQVSCNEYNTCVVLEDGGVLCWGQDTQGELGQGNNIEADNVQIGDDEEPDSLDPIVLGDTAESIAVGANHVCALTSSANLRCWGYGAYGVLGYGDTYSIGDDENPEVAGPSSCCKLAA